MWSTAQVELFLRLDSKANHLLTLLSVLTGPSLSKFSLFNGSSNWKLVDSTRAAPLPIITEINHSFVMVSGDMASNQSLANGVGSQTAQHSSEEEHVDVVVIGAGLAGLTAAEHIVKAGYSCKVLEARDRVGGRTWSPKRETPGVIDIGAAWFNDTNQRGMIGLARRFNLELVTQNTNGDVIMQTDKLQRFAYGQAPNASASTTI